MALEAEELEYPDFLENTTEEDYHDFLETFCTDEFIEYYSSKENPNSDN